MSPDRHEQMRQASRGNGPPSLLSKLSQYEEVGILHPSTYAWQVSLDGSPWSTVQTTLDGAIAAAERGEYRAKRERRTQ